MKLPRPLALALACLPLALHAQNVVFNDSFTGDSLEPATYPAVTASSTGWEIASSKAAPAPTNSSGLQFNMVSTSSGFIESQALFAPAPIQLLPGTFIELTGVFTPTNVLVHASDVLNVGLFNANGSAPLNGMQSSGLVNTTTTFAAGGVAGWQGYNAYIAFTAGTSKMDTRAAQTSSNNTNQDLVVGPQSSTAGYSTPAPVSIAQSATAVAALVNGNTYTLDYKLALAANGTTLTATYSIYNGTGTTNSGANTLVASYSGNISGATLLTTAFNGLALGWRADASLVSDLNFSSLAVSTTGGAPWFITEPLATLTASLGGNLSLTAAVGGTVATYQWQKSADGVTFAAIDPAANPSAATMAFSINGVQASDAGTYRLVVTNAAGSTTSTPTVVTVTAGAVAPSIAANPVGATLTAGASYTFSVTANGTSPLAYQWSQSTDGGLTFNPISGATNSSLAIASATLANSGQYEVTVSNVAGSITSAPATLTVVQPPSISVQPAGTALAVGASYTLSVSASGSPPPTFQWFRNGAPIIGATGSSFTIASATGASAGEYTVVISNSAGANVTSAVAAIAVLSPTLVSTALTPASGAPGLNPDTRLTIAFNQPISVGVSGQINIFDAANPGTPVDTIDLVAGTALMNSLRAASPISTQLLPVQNKTIGGLTNFNYYPITVSGSTATIYPKNNVLAYGHSYFVTVDPGVFTDSTGLSFPGLAGNSAWSFSAKASGPAAGTTSLVVAADGSGDFSTVQGALDFISAGNTTPTTITVNAGTYFEQVYFTGKHAVTIAGTDRAGTVITYPNNNTFNNTTGSYHRMVFQADHVNNVVVKNLTVQNSTPHGGSQAEALLLNGTLTSQAIVTGVNLVSFQDTLQINGQAYISDSHISGDVDFIWGQGPNFFNNCELTALTSSGYYTQIRNPSTNHGDVFLNCTVDATPGVTGSNLGRIDPTPVSGFPFSEVVYINCVLGTSAGGADATNVSAAGWLLNNTPDQTAASAPNVHFWEYNSHFPDGNLLNVASRIGASQQLTQPASAATIANYSTPSFVLGNGLDGTPWSPAQPPTIQTQPAAASFPQGGVATFTVVAIGAPPPAYVWSLNGVALTNGTQADGSVISGATTATLTITGIAADQNGAALTVAATNTGGTVTSSSAVLTVTAPLPTFTTQPAAQTAAGGAGVTFTAAAANASSLQWNFNGSPITGNPTATTATLTLGSLTPLNAGSYTVMATNAGGTKTSNAAILNVLAAAGEPVLPVIPGGVFAITTFGAVADGATDNTAAIQATINAAQAAGGGTVEIPPAPLPYRSGPLTVGSSISLQVDGGATLQALPFATYPNAGSSPAVFISFKNATNVQVVGGGTVDGNGADWWTAFNGNSNLKRPQMIKFAGCTNVLVAGVTLTNAPTEHLVPAATNLTIDGITVSTLATSPNTDGIDPSGTNVLIENCSISDGDDNIAIKPQNLFCTNLVITNCSFGSGHGLSIGGQTNDGLDGLTVTHCTFNGTTTGLRLKADPTEGGLVQNLSFSDITMMNVQSPIVFYSYYNIVGSPGAVSGSNQTTATKVNFDNANPPNSLASSTIPVWKNITVNNLTATGASAYSIIWGLPLANALYSNVTLNNVNISGGPGFEIYDATNVQLTGNTNVGPILSANALALTGQPQSQTASVGGTATFTAAAAGTGGVAGTPPSFSWALNGTALSDGLQADGSTIAGSATGTLTISNARVTEAGSYVATVSNQLDGYNVAASALSPNSLPVSMTTTAATLTVQPVPAVLTLSNVSQTYTGTPEFPTVVSSPLGAKVTVTYNGNATIPTAAGTYAVVATVNDPNFTGGTVTGTLVIAKATPLLAWSPPATLQAGVPLDATQLDATASVPGTFVYSPAAGATLTAGANQALSAVFTPADSVDFASGTVSTTINVTPGTATVSLANLSQIYDGTGKSVAVATVPTGLSTSVTYGGSSTLPVVAGSYAVVATVTNPSFTGSATGTLVITKAAPVLTWNPPTAIAAGIALSATQLNATANTAGTFVYAPPAGTVLSVGTGHVLSAAFTPTDGTDYTTGSVSTSITVSANPATIVLGDLSEAYTGLPVTVTATTTPANLTYSVTYNGSATAPTYPGTYAVVATITDATHTGTASGSLVISTTALVNQAPVLNGNAAFTGSIQMLLPQSVNMSGNAFISNDLLVPGTPALQTSGNARVAGTIDSGGTAAPTNYQVALSGNTVLRHLVRQINPLTMPTVAAPPASSQNVTLNGNAPPTPLAPGNYGTVIVNGNTTLILGTAGATTPSIYNIQSLTVNGNGVLQIAGPATVIVGSATTFSGNAGAKANPEWLVLCVANGGVTLNGNVTFSGSIIAPRGQVIVNGNSTVKGTVISDSLLLNSGAVTDPGL